MYRLKVERPERFLPLPADSPDFNPIEEAFSKVKQVLRRAKARTDDDLRDATWRAFATISPRDAAGWFTHCGYPPTINPHEGTVAELFWKLPAVGCERLCWGEAG